MNQLFYKKKPISGLDINMTGIEIMSINRDKVVTSYGMVNLDPEKALDAFNKPSDYLSDNLKYMIDRLLVGTMPSNYVAVSVPTSKTFIRTFKLPVEVEANIDESVKIEATQYIPIPIEALYLNYQIVERTKKDLTILMCAVAKSIVDNVIASVKMANLRPILVEPSINSIGRLLSLTERGKLPSIIVNIGSASTDIAIFNNSSIRVTGDVSIGNNTFTLDISNALSVSLEEAHRLKLVEGLSFGPRQAKIAAAMNTNLQRILLEVRRVIKYYNERINNGTKLEQLLIVGDGSNIPGIGDYFTDKLVMPARAASPWQDIRFDKLDSIQNQVHAQFTTAAGLAIIDPAEII